VERKSRPANGGEPATAKRMPHHLWQGIRFALPLYFLSSSFFFNDKKERQSTTGTIPVLTTVGIEAVSGLITAFTTITIVAIAEMAKQTAIILLCFDTGNSTIPQNFSSF
jgi:heme A synthase